MLHSLQDQGLFRASPARTKTFSIGELSKRSGVIIGTIRFYERMKVLPASPRTASGRRAYPPSLPADCLSRTSSPAADSGDQAEGLTGSAPRLSRPHLTTSAGPRHLCVAGSRYRPRPQPDKSFGDKDGAGIALPARTTECDGWSHGPYKLALPPFADAVVERAIDAIRAKEAIK
jgi:hypothetical protein